MSDFIVIGGGIAGISVSARLSALGRVVVLEREKALGYHSTGRSAALYEENYGKPSTIALNKASGDHLRNTQGGVLTPRGLLMLGTADTAEVFARDLADMQLEEVGLPEAVSLFPILDRQVVTRAAVHRGCADIDVDLLLQNFARTLRENGGEVRTGAQVTAIERQGSNWIVRAHDTEFAAPLLVNAAGAWADEIAKLAGIAPLGLTPLRRSMGRIPAPGGRDVSAWPMVFGPGETWYAKPDAGALLVSPADEDPCPPMDAYPDDMVLAEGFARYEAMVTEPVTRLLSSWAGLRTFAPDRQLVLGRDRADPGFVWCAGQGGYGVQSSPAASQLIADIVAGKQSELGADIVASLSPERFG